MFFFCLFVWLLIRDLHHWSLSSSKTWLKSNRSGPQAEALRSPPPRWVRTSKHCALRFSITWGGAPFSWSADLPRLTQRYLPGKPVAFSHLSRLQTQPFFFLLWSLHSLLTPQPPHPPTPTHERTAEGLYMRPMVHLNAPLQGCVLLLASKLSFSQFQQGRYEPPLATHHPGSAVKGGCANPCARGPTQSPSSPCKCCRLQGASEHKNRRKDHPEDNRKSLRESLWAMLGWLTWPIIQTHPSHIHTPRNSGGDTVPSVLHTLV